MLIDHTNGRVLDLLPDRDKDSFVKWLQQGKASGLLAHLVEFTTDMWEGYRNAVHEVFGKEMRVTIDRFHVMKQFQERLTAAGGEYFADKRLTVADLKIFMWIRWLRSGVLDYIPKDLVDRVAPLLVQHFERVASHPRVAEYYKRRKAA